jgi:hypothetical protein
LTCGAPSPSGTEPSHNPDASNPPLDAAAEDAGEEAASGLDSAPPPCTPSDAGIPFTAPPPLLSDTGLFQDILAGTIAPGVREFHPSYELWSDGAAKRRWVSLPGCDKIDTSNMDAWSFPVGTRFWKEFVVQGKKIETRLIMRTGPGANDFLFAAYQWNSAGTDATYVPLGQNNANGTNHDIPNAITCLLCHGQRPERILGFSAVQLSHAEPGVNLGVLQAEQRMTVPYSGYTIPGDSTAQQALGYLHANCGTCHNPSGLSFPTPFSLRLSVSHSTVESTDAFKTAVNVPVNLFAGFGVTHRIKPQDTAASSVHYRMSLRTLVQMPPIASEVVDDAGVAAVGAWINALPSL